MPPTAAASLRPNTYTHRFYRNLTHPAGGSAFQVHEGESDLWIHTDHPRETRASQALREIRTILTRHIAENPEFKTALVPLPPCYHCPQPVREMLEAARIAGVGPMAGVAGAVARYVGQAILHEGALHVLVENGGDLFIHRPHAHTTIAVFSGQSPLSMKIGIKIPPTAAPVGMATSSGTVGPSLSFGKADAVCALSPNAILADTAATAIANRIRSTEDLESALAWGSALEGVTGIVAVAGADLAAWGEIELVKL